MNPDLIDRRKKVYDYVLGHSGCKVVDVAQALGIGEKMAQREIFSLIGSGHIYGAGEKRWRQYWTTTHPNAVGRNEKSASFEFGNGQRSHSSRPLELINYKEYVNSPYWTERKKQYFASHAHSCVVCGHPDVELHHLMYGDYGREEDRNLAALCRAHHQEFHEKVKLRKDMKHAGISVIDEMKREWREMREAPLQAVPEPNDGSSFADVVEQLASPIWKLLHRFF